MAINGFEGVEMTNAKNAARQFDESAVALAGMTQRLERANHELVWVGESAKGFKDDWDGQFVGDLNRAITMLTDYCGGIRDAIAKQERASREE